MACCGRIGAAGSGDQGCSLLGRVGVVGVGGGQGGEAGDEECCHAHVDLLRKYNSTGASLVIRSVNA